MRRSEDQTFPRPPQCSQAERQRRLGWHEDYNTATAGRRAVGWRQLPTARTGEAMGVSPGLSGKAEAAVPIFRFPVPRSEGRAQWSLRFRAAGRGRPVTVSREESAAERSRPGARTVITGQTRPSIPARRVSVATESRRRAWGVSLGSPERPRLPTRFVPRSGDSGGWLEGRRRPEARRIA